MAGLEIRDFSAPVEVRRPKGVAPGHDGWVLGGEPAVVVEFQDAANYVTR